MARYLVERTFPDGLAIPMTSEGAQVCLPVDSITPVSVLDPYFYQ